MDKREVTKKYQIVIVDDSPTIHAIMKRYLEADEIEIISCMNGAQGIEYLKKNRPDLIFLDIIMPQKDGLEVLREIRESKNNAQTPVIMLSSKDYDQDKNSAYALGATAFLSKPPIKQQLQDKLNQFLSQK